MACSSWFVDPPDRVFLRLFCDVLFCDVIVASDGCFFEDGFDGVRFVDTDVAARDAAPEATSEGALKGEPARSRRGEYISAASAV